MYNDVEPFDSSDNLHSAYSPLGRNFGHPYINAAIQMLVGQNYMPASDNGQSMHDAVLQRNRSTEFMNLQRSGLMNNGMVSRMGLAGNPMVGMLGSIASPDSALARTMSPFLGGNPMAAQMQLYAGLAGGGVMGNFGRMGAITAGETEDTMQAIEKVFYKHQNFEGPGGAREEINAQGKQAFRNIAMGPDANKIYEDLGFKGVEVDKNGKLNAKGEEILNKLNIADDENDLTKKMLTQAEAKKSTADSLTTDIDSLMAKEGGKIDKGMREVLLERMRSSLDLTRDQVEKLRGERSYFGLGIGEPDMQKMKDELAKLKVPTPFTAGAEKAAEIKKAGSRIQGFDFEKSRGFKLEDFTSGFVKAADLRMLGDQKGKGVAQSAEEFAEVSGGAMSAARAVFGNKSGAELVSKISNIAGADVNLGNEQGADKVEELLRKVNATARVAGISIKTMLSIIDAGKQLAANHPALQSTSSAAITQLAMKAVGTAVSLGSTMSATEYRKAGGAQGIASQEIKTAQEFAAGPVGATIAAAYYGATDEQKTALDKLLENKPVTGRALDETLRSEMAKVRGISVGKLNMLATDNPGLVAEAMKDDRTANKVYESAKPAITAAALEHFNRAGLSTEELVKKYKESKGDFSQVDALARQYIVPGTQDERVWNHAKIGVREKLEDMLRDPKEKAAYTKFKEIRDQSAKDEAVMDKKYSSRYAPIITQVVDALSQGETPKDITSAFTNIFSTENVKTDKAKAALESAKKSGSKMADIIGVKGVSDEALIKKGGLVNALNDFIKNRKDVGEATGDTADTAHLGALSESEVTLAAKMGGHMDLKNAEQGREELEKLEKLSKTDAWKDRVYDSSREKLTVLKALKKADILDSDKAFSVWQRGGVKALTSATVMAAADANFKKTFKEEKTELTKSMSNQFDVLAETNKEDENNNWDVNYLKNYYTDKSGTVEYDRMLKDKSKGTGAFDKKDFGDYWNDKEAGRVLGETQDKIALASSRSDTTSATSPELQSRKDLGDAMNKLIAVLGDGGVIGTGLTQLIKAIQGI